MIKLTKKKIVWALSILLAIMIMAVGIVFVVGSANAPATYTIEGLKDNYVYGYTLDLPDGYVNVDGKNHELDTLVSYPDGRKTNYSSIDLDCIGTYKVKYFTTVDNINYEQEKTFEVSRAMENQFVNVKDVEFVSNFDGPAETGYYNKTTGVQTKHVPYNGVKIKATSRDAQFRYNGVMDLTKLKKETPFVEFLFVPEQQGKIEAASVTFKFTDIYDENNYITMRMVSNANYGPYHGSSVITFSANDMYPKTGILETNTNVYDCPECFTRTSWSTMQYKEESETVHKYTCPECNVTKQYEKKPLKDLYYTYTDVYGVDHGSYTGDYVLRAPGSHLATSFYGKYNPGDNYLSASMYFDTDTQTIWKVNPYKPASYGGLWKIFDFKDSKLLGSNVWDGFTTGEVYFDIFVEGSAAGANMLFTSVNGMSLSGDGAVKDQPVSISVDKEGYYELPHGVAGVNNTYPVLNAIAYSANSGIIKDVNAYVYYHGETRDIIPIVNGRFKTERAGEYYIEYSATDDTGVSAKKMQKIIVDDSSNQIDYQISSSIKDYYSFGVDKIYLYEGSAVGGSGNLTVDTVVEFGGNKVDVIQSGSIGYFEPKEAGIYKTTYTVTDFIGNSKQFTKMITVADDGKPIFEEFYTPKAIRAGFNYEFPTIKATVAGSQEATIEILVNGSKIEGNTYKPTLAGEITVDYVAINKNDASKKTTITNTIKVLDKKEVFSTSYLLTENMTYKEDTLTYLAYDITSENASMYFANALASSVASITWSFAPNKANVDTVRVTITDATTGRAYQIDVVNTNGIPVAWHAGQKWNDLSGSFGAETARTMGLFYAGDGYIRDSGNKSLGRLKYSTDGREFVEFGETVFIELEFIGADVGNTVFELRTINKQAFNNDLDWAAPTLYIKNPVPDVAPVSYGEQVVVQAAKAFDVVGAVTEVSVIVLDPSGKTVYSGAIDKDYTFTANQYGSYRVTYVVVDDSGNSEDALVVAYNVLDEQAPVISDAYIEKTVYEVGDVFEVPEFTATDNCDAEDAITKYVLICDYEDMYRIIDDSYTFTQKGKYRIRYVASDSSYNTSYVEIEVYVK